MNRKSPRWDIKEDLTRCQSKECVMITAKRMAMVDLNAAELGVSQIQLMESSGHAVAREVKKIAAGGEKN